MSLTRIESTLASFIFDFFCLPVPKHGASETKNMVIRTGSQTDRPKDRNPLRSIQ